MKTKYITLIFILSMLGCATVPPTIVGDPQLIYDVSDRIGGVGLAALFLKSYLDSINGWDVEAKKIWIAYYAYFTAAQLSIARGDSEGFEANLKAAQEQLKILTRSAWGI